MLPCLWWNRPILPRLVATRCVILVGLLTTTLQRRPVVLLRAVLINVLSRLRHGVVRPGLARTIGKGRFPPLGRTKTLSRHRNLLVALVLFGKTTTLRLMWINVLRCPLTLGRTINLPMTGPGVLVVTTLGLARLRQCLFRTCRPVRVTAVFPTGFPTMLGL